MAVILQPSQGRLEIIDLRTGQTMSTSQLGKLRGVQSIELHRMRDLYLLEVNLNQFFRSNVSDPKSGAAYQSLDYRQPLLHGFLFALSPADGRLLWDVPAKIEYFDVATPLLPNSPLAVVTRFQSTEDERVLQMAAIDLQTGALAVPLQSQSTYNRRYQVEYDAGQRRLLVRVGSLDYELSLSDERQPPGAVATLVNERNLGVQPPFPISSPSGDAPKLDLNAVLEELRQERIELEKKREDMQRRFPDRPGGPGESVNPSPPRGDAPEPPHD
jgi:hypothetical protein